MREMARRSRRRDVTVSLTTVAMPQKREFLKSNLVRVIVGISTLTATADLNKWDEGNAYV